MLAVNEVENSRRPSVLKKNKIKIKYKNGKWTKYVVKEVNRLEDMAKKLKPPRKHIQMKLFILNEANIIWIRLKKKIT